MWSDTSAYECVMESAFEAPQLGKISLITFRYESTTCVKTKDTWCFSVMNSEIEQESLANIYLLVINCKFSCICYRFGDIHAWR